MPRQLHRVVQYPADHHEAGLCAVDKEVPWSARALQGGFHVLSAEAQVPGANAGAELGPLEASRPVWLARHIAEGGDETTAP
jgi:hypothetical protein